MQKEERGESAFISRGNGGGRDNDAGRVCVLCRYGGRVYYVSVGAFESGRVDALTLFALALDSASIRVRCSPRASPACRHTGHSHKLHLTVTLVTQQSLVQPLSVPGLQTHVG